MHKFQKDNKLMDDGVIGNETWAALRNGEREKPSTDGRTPHTFEEKGKQGRWTLESKNIAVFDTAANLFTMLISSTGEVGIGDNKATVRVTQPEGTSKTQAVTIGPVTGHTPDGQGEQHTLTIEKFTEVFKIANPALVGSCLVEAYLDKEIGGDSWKGNPVVK